jgi:hypothetical protein
MSNYSILIELLMGTATGIATWHTIRQILLTHLYKRSSYYQEHLSKGFSLVFPHTLSGAIAVFGWVWFLFSPF